VRQVFSAWIVNVDRGSRSFPQRWGLDRFSGGFVEGGADFVYVGSVGANGFVQFFAGNTEFVRPISDIGGHFGVDLFGVVRAFDGLYVLGVGLAGFRFFDFFVFVGACGVGVGHSGFLFRGDS
jgi:hypothetical protein